MRPARLVVLVGALLGTAALYSHHLAVDGAAFAALTGGRLPSIWAELGRWGRPAAGVVAAGLVALAFRPAAGWADSFGGAVGVAVAGAALIGALAARSVAVEDAATVNAALSAASMAGGAAPGAGFWVLVGATVVVAGAAAWDLAGAFEEDRPGGRRMPSPRGGGGRPRARPPGPGPRPATREP